MLKEKVCNIVLNLLLAKCDINDEAVAFFEMGAFTSVATQYLNAVAILCDDQKKLHNKNILIIKESIMKCALKNYVESVKVSQEHDDHLDTVVQELFELYPNDKINPNMIKEQLKQLYVSYNMEVAIREDKRDDMARSPENLLAQCAVSIREILQSDGKTSIRKFTDMISSSKGSPVYLGL